MTNIEPGILDIRRIREDLKPRRVGKSIEHLTSVGSTNDQAWNALGREDSDGFVVLAEHQSAGKGRLGRAWLAPRGACVLCSLLLIDRHKKLNSSKLVLITAIAVYDTIVQVAHLHPTIKWPNDIMVDRRKLAGILIESRTTDDGGGACVVGIGINCLQHRTHFPHELVDKATSLEIESPHPIDRSSVAITLLRELDSRLSESMSTDGTQLKREWIARAYPFGQRVHLYHKGRSYRGTAVDLDPTAALVVQLDEGGVRLFGAMDTTILEDDQPDANSSSP